MKENNEKLAVVVAGGNGAGKSTFINHQLLPLYKTTGINYINADDWQKKHFGIYPLRCNTLYPIKSAKD